MVVQLRPRAITVERGSRGFGLSLIYRGLDKFEEKDTGIFVARVVPGGQAARYGLKENDKLLTINGKTPRNVDDAVGVIKQAGNQIKLVVLREEDVQQGNPDITIDPAEADRASLASQEIDSKWVSIKKDTLLSSRCCTLALIAPMHDAAELCQGRWLNCRFFIPLQMRDAIGGSGQPISRSGSARSFNTSFGRPPASPSPRPPRAHVLLLYPDTYMTDAWC